MANKKEDYSLDIIKGITIAAIVMIITFSVAGYNYGLFIGNLRGIHKIKGIEEMCNIVNGTMEDNDYCLIEDLSKENSTAYKHYFDCSWGKFTVVSIDRHILLDPKIWVIQCRRTKIMELI